MTNATPEKPKGFFSDYEVHQGHTLDKNLLWEYDLSIFNWERSIQIVVERVFERGSLEDFYALFNMYGYARVVETVKNIPSMTDREAAFASTVLDIPLKEMKCSKKPRWRHTHWIS